MKKTQKSGYIAPEMELLKCNTEAIVCASLNEVSEVEYDFEWE